MKIVGIAGSMNKSSTTKQAVAIVLDAAKAAGADIEMIHLADWKLPIYDDREDASTYPEVVHRFVQKISEADGLVIGSPEYHGTMTGALKNALDFLEGRHLRDKQVALVGVAGGSMGATNTVNTLQLIMRNLHAWPLPASPSIPSAYNAFTPDGKLKDERLQARMETLGQQLVEFVNLMNQKAEKQLQ
ncbi:MULTISPECIES: NADPH-dependent FMN reductase [Brevibacillus]|uniref:NADPH-dependent FMN reductase n=1 Tax=Brevibacillus TaxID=55080 RepID=UPI00040C7D21|nr:MULTISPECIES: NADPH-dependent FMN reductase [Brevibacillus]MBY0051509.1 NAD(P)H-dependent oxidoreductase [Brevibacillus agri]MED1823645.1 NAD(P)H-dependent oxidoreductase [Brevibacillus agri]QHZ57070.1 NAD(P)H-dependent oxidoreductase [Brevibacillus sp. NSP2.1]